MEKIVIVLVFIALLAGLGGGFGLGYVIYQPQLQTLQTDLGNLNSKLEVVTNKSWHEVYSLASSSDVITGTIQLRGYQVRGMWIAQSAYSAGWFSVQLHFSNGTEYAVWGSSGVWTANNAILELPQTGSYYLNITTYQTYYAFSFWDYY